MSCNAIDKKKLHRYIAISLIVMSFLLYIIIPFNVCLPFSACVIAGITGAMMLVSEIIFWIGSLMIGRDVAMKIKKKFSIKNLIRHLKKK
jgi:hypothetical protein